MCPLCKIDASLARNLTFSCLHSLQGCHVVSIYVFLSSASSDEPAPTLPCGIVAKTPPVATKPLVAIAGLLVARPSGGSTLRHIAPHGTQNMPSNVAFGVPLIAFGPILVYLWSATHPKAVLAGANSPEQLTLGSFWTRLVARTGSEQVLS